MDRVIGTSGDLVIGKAKALPQRTRRIKEETILKSGKGKPPTAEAKETRRAAKVGESEHELTGANGIPGPENRIQESR